MRCLVLLLLLLGFQSHGNTLPDYCPKPMTIVFYGDWYPYMFKEGDGYKGIDYEFMRLINAELGCDIVVNALPEKRAHQGLARGDSIIMSGATITEKREKYAYFSDTYRGETMSLFYLPHRVSGQHNADNIIAGSKMIAINGAAYYGPFIEGYRNNDSDKKFQHVPSLEKRVEMLTRHRADAMVEDHIAGCNALFNDTNKLTVKLKWVQVNQVNVAFMFSKGVVPYEFIEIFNHTMQQLIAQGALDKLIAKYTPQGCK